MSTNKEKAFLEYAKKKKWDASICVYDDRYIAILNPIDNKGILEGESSESIDDAIDDCKSKLMKSLKK